MRLIKAANSIFAQIDPKSVHKSAREQYQKERLMESLRSTNPERDGDSKIVDALISEILEADPSELYFVYMRHTRQFPDFVNKRRYRAALSYKLTQALTKTATFYSRYGGLHHDQDVTRIEPQDAGSVRATMPQEPVDGKPTFSPGSEESLFTRRTGQKRRRGEVSSHAHMKEDPQTPNVEDGRPSLNVDEMNVPSRDSRNFESL